MAEQLPFIAIAGGNGSTELNRGKTVFGLAIKETLGKTTV
jgi:hypothetical protein